jgi:hypothetical protein
MDDPPCEIRYLDYTPLQAREAGFLKVLDLGFGFVGGPSQLHRNGDHDGKEKAGKLGMLGPEHLGQVKPPGPVAGRGSDQTCYQGNLQSPHERPFSRLYARRPRLVPSG